MTESENLVMSGIARYLCSSNIDYSILISGSWGTGKTYFIKDKLVHNEYSKCSDCIYISAAGKTTSSEVLTDILGQIIQRKVPGGGIKKILSSLSNLKRTVFNRSEGKFKLMFESIDLISDMFFEGFIKEKQIKTIIIDDLERYCGKLDELIPHIHDKLVENNVHVIYVADEEKIKHEQFIEIKEKYIRYVIAFNSDIKNALIEIGNKLDSKTPFYKMFKDNSNEIIKNIQEMQLFNFRTYLTAIECFNYFMEMKQIDLKELVLHLFSLILLHTAYLKEPGNEYLEKEYDEQIASVIRALNGKNCEIRTVEKTKEYKYPKSAEGFRLFVSKHKNYWRNYKDNESEKLRNFDYEPVIVEFLTTGAASKEDVLRFLDTKYIRNSNYFKDLQLLKAPQMLQENELRTVIFNVLKGINKRELTYDNLLQVSVAIEISEKYLFDLSSKEYKDEIILAANDYEYFKTGQYREYELVDSAGDSSFIKNVKAIIKKQQIRSSEEKDREKFLNLLNLAIEHYYIEISSYNFVIKSIKYDLIDYVLAQGNNIIYSFYCGLCELKDRELTQEDVILLKKLETAVIANINKITVDSMEYLLKKDILDCVKNILDKKIDC